MKKCPYCAEEIQDEAIICRYCQKPFSAQGIPDNPIQTVELTGKKYKKRQLWGCSGVLIGVVLVIVSFGFAGNSTASAVALTIIPLLGMMLCLAGVILYFSAKFGAWWNHK
jgi:uncharacterized membrane protein YvbJ